MPALLMKLLGSPRLLGAVGVAVLLSLVALQTARLHHAKADLAAARLAQLDPATHRPWQAEAKAAGTDLAACQAGLAEQSAAVAALQAAGEQASAEAQAALAKAQGQARDAGVRAAAILQAKPATGACADALILKSLAP